MYIENLLILPFCTKVFHCAVCTVDAFNKRIFVFLHLLQCSVRVLFLLFCVFFSYIGWGIIIIIINSSVRIGLLYYPCDRYPYNRFCFYHFFRCSSLVFCLLFIYIFSSLFFGCCCCYFWYAITLVCSIAAFFSSLFRFWYACYISGCA